MFDYQSFINSWFFNPESPLLFTSKTFLILFALFLVVYNMIYKRLSSRILYLTAFSIYFYYLTTGSIFWLLILISFTDYSLGFFINASTNKIERKIYLFISIIIDLGVLCYFKYTNFFGEMISNLMNQPYLIKNIILPVGISFYIFQSISYVIDIYRKTLKPAERWIDYLFYLSFFPQLVAGPIVRAKDFLPQIKKSPLVTSEMANRGLQLILLGFIKKVIISDYISVNFVDRIFDAPLQYTGFENLIGVYGYALQIYCDFSGYSDIAIGIALLLGFRYPENFNTPYKSATITEFWHRWHISLSTWLKDYLYISLGGNRKGKIRTYLNLMITMLLGGLWHGASLQFIIWGGLHGIALCSHKIFMKICPSSKVAGSQMKPFNRFFSTLITFNFVCFCWIFFRASDLNNVYEILSQISTNFSSELIYQRIEVQWKIFSLIIIGYCCHFVRLSTYMSLKEIFYSLPVWSKAIISVLTLWMVMQIQADDVQPFIYFKF